MTLIPGVTGLTIAKNWIELDYPGFLTIESMLPVCDEILVSDGGSSDGTLERLLEWASIEPKLRIMRHPESLWPDSDQVGNSWINTVRKQARYQMTLWLDADEVLDPSGYDEIREAANLREARIFNYVNFWMDAQHTTPWGDGRKLHLQRADQFIHVHGENPPEWVDVRTDAKTHPSLVSYHYSALRKQEAFIAKCKVIGKRHAFGFADQPLIQAEKTGESFMPLYKDRCENMRAFDGNHPAFMAEWLRERGWTP